MSVLLSRPAAVSGPGLLFATSTSTAAPRLVSMGGSHQYPFPSIPRPKRNASYYYYNPVASLRRGFSSIPKSRPGMMLMKGSVRIKNRLTNPVSANASGTGDNVVAGSRLSSRYFSTASEKVKFSQNWRWIAVPAVTTIILWTVYRRKYAHDQDFGADFDQNEDTEDRPLLGGRRQPKPAKPWQVAAYSTLPLKALSRLWGRFNDITLPVWMRTPGYKLYSYIFGVNLDEVAEDDLTKYANLGEFFYRELKPGSRPIDDAILVSPADGKVLHLGVINGGQVEQVKGITYSLDALLGVNSTSGSASQAPSHYVDFSSHEEDIDIHERDKEFAVMNGISYTLDDLIGDEEHGHSKIKKQGDKTVSPSSSSLDLTNTVSVTKDLMVPDTTPESEKELFFAVIYLAPGDYHRFHSPTNWVAELRRHFVGELYSVAPFFQQRLQGLFCLNERVALLGKWKYGFFSMTPVGATNVGSIRIHFDKDLRTNKPNSAYRLQNDLESESQLQSEHNTASSSSSSSASTYVDAQSPSASSSTTSLTSTNSSSSSSTSTSDLYKNHRYKGMCYEANYSKASKLLRGYPLVKGQQMGGFNLGSTVVLVFEAPKAFHFTVKPGHIIKVGEKLGELCK